MPTATIVKSREFGAQSTHLELPDIVYLRLQGMVTLEEARLINETHLEYAQDVSHFFYLINLEGLDNLPAPVRKEASSVVKILPPPRYRHLQRPAPRQGARQAAAHRRQPLPQG